MENVKRKGLNWFCENILVRLNGAKLYFAGPVIDKEEFRKVNSHPQTEYLGIISEEEKLIEFKDLYLQLFPTLLKMKTKTLKVLVFH